MGKPVASISVPKDSAEEWSRCLPRFVRSVGPLSPAVLKMVTNGLVANKAELQGYIAKEALTSRDKYLIIELD